MEGCITLRSGVAGDLLDMFELDVLCFSEPFCFDLTAMRRYVNQRGSIVIVAEAEGTLAAFIIVNIARRAEGPSAYITTLDVHPDYRRHGLASRLLALAKEKIVEAGITDVRLHVFVENAAAILLYERVGFDRAFQVQDFYGRDLHAWVYVEGLSSLPVAQ